MSDYSDEYRDKIQEIVSKSEDDFDKKILTIASGALAISFSFISFLVSINNCKWLLIIGWFLLIICIFTNLFSHLSSKRNAQKTIEDLDNGKPEDEDNVRCNIIKRNKRINLINLLSVIFLLVGVLLIIIFAAINL
ncbi:MAG: hypothetical protein H6Q16_2117 [Bacteroidetes bacterium]|nr:hypothetical protein [Bacteroidota bacterium]